MKTSKDNSIYTTKVMVKIAMLSVISVILMIFQTPVPFALEFLKLDLSDIPPIICAIAFGPVPAILCQLIKNLLHLALGFSTTASIGEMANFFIGSALILPIAITMRNNKTLKNYIIGGILGVILMCITAFILNYYILLPVYAKAYGVTTDFYIEMGQQIVPQVDNLFNLILYTMMPFNVLKGTIAVVGGGIIFKLVKKPLLDASIK